MQRWSSTVLFLLLVASAGVQAQSRSTLESERNALLRQIKQTNTLISDTRNQQTATVNKLVAMRKEIDLRQAVVTTLESEVSVVNKQISRQEAELANMRESMVELQNRQAQQLRSAYIKKRLENRMAFILSARSLNEAYARWRYMGAFKKARESLFHKLSSAADSIQVELNRLEVMQAEKSSLLSDIQTQTEQLDATIARSEEILRTLKKDEKSLKDKLKKQERESKRLANEIEKIIKAEIASSRKTSALPDAPAIAAVSREFSQNKGKLPWPVKQGLITGHFGTQSHPVIPSIKIVNNGVDITAPEGSSVLAIFGGKVVGKRVIPGFDHMLIIRHGEYYTVYSRLSKVVVDLDDEVQIGQYLGLVSVSEEGDHRLHLEVWHGKIQLDPEAWIAR